MTSSCVRLVQILVIVGVLHAAGADRLRGYSHVRTIDTSSITREVIVAVPLDAALYGGTREDYADLRVVDDRDQEVPYLLKKEIETRSVMCEEKVPVTVKGLEEIVDNRIAITAERTDSGPGPSILVVHTHIRDFEKLVRVSGRNRGGQWHVLAEGQTIFDYHRFMDVSGNRIHLRAGDFREFRIEVSDVTDVQMSTCMKLVREVRGGEAEKEIASTVLKRRDFRIDRLEFLRLVTREKQSVDKTVERVPAAVSVAQDPRDHETEITVTFVGQPLCGLKLVPSSRNFHREARVDVERGRSQGRGWAELRRGTVTSLALGRYEKENLCLSFPETRGKRYRVVVANHDAPPLDIRTVIGIGKSYRLLFLASPERQYRVLQGRAEAEVPVYDSDHVLKALLRQGDVSPAVLHLGPLEENPAFAPGARPLAWLGTQVALIAAIVLAVVALGWAIYHAAKNVEKITDES